MTPLDFGIPAGSLQGATIELFRRAGWHIVIASRNYFPEVDDDDLRLTLMRAQEMSRYVEHGTFDAGITGKDWTLENQSDVEVIQVLPYSRRSNRPTRAVLAVREDSPIRTVQDLEGATIAAEMVNFTRCYLAERGITANVEFSWGATEAKVAGRLADAIVETTETGSTLRAHGLREVETMLTSCPQIIANKIAYADPVKKAKIDQVAMMLKSALDAQSRVALKMNVPKDLLKEIIALVPSVTAPTVADLYGQPWASVEIVVEEQQVRELMPRLVNAGAEGIIEFPLNKFL
ncbi:MAG: ATP phosphoribosyltransferase [Chloroflexota bacterium]|nr:ATP phosphoribosyltransferase [Chloroflexota bacterium]